MYSKCSGFFLIASSMASTHTFAYGGQAYYVNVCDNRNKWLSSLRLNTFSNILMISYLLTIHSWSFTAKPFTLLLELSTKAGVHWNQLTFLIYYFGGH